MFNLLLTIMPKIKRLYDGNRTRFTLIYEEDSRPVFKMDATILHGTIISVDLVNVDRNRCTNSLLCNESASFFNHLFRYIAELENPKVKYILDSDGEFVF